MLVIKPCTMLSKCWATESCTQLKRTSPDLDEGLSLWRHSNCCPNLLLPFLAPRKLASAPYWLRLTHSSDNHYSHHPEMFLKLNQIQLALACTLTCVWGGAHAHTHAYSQAQCVLPVQVEGQVSGVSFLFALCLLGIEFKLWDSSCKHFTIQQICLPVTKLHINRIISMWSHVWLLPHNTESVRVFRTVPRANYPHASCPECVGNAPKRTDLL